jgi:hypothetical protein
MQLCCNGNCCAATKQDEVPATPGMPVAPGINTADCFASLVDKVNDLPDAVCQ